MKTEKDKYYKLIETLRRSTPEMDQYNAVEDAVFQKILKKSDNELTGILDFLFGWIYIGWVRRSLIATSFALLGFFLWQQNNIMNQIDDLRSSIRENDRLIVYNQVSALERRQMLLKFSRERSGGYYISEEDLTLILDSLKNMNIRYKDLMDLIDNDTVLKKRVEEKIEKKLGSRIKL